MNWVPSLVKARSSHRRGDPPDVEHRELQGMLPSTLTFFSDPGQTVQDSTDVRQLKDVLTCNLCYD